MIILQILGAGSFIVGLLIFIGFPWTLVYQPESMGRGGVLLGILLMVIGILLMKI